MPVGKGGAATVTVTKRDLADSSAASEVTWPELLLPVSAVNDTSPGDADVATFKVATGDTTSERVAPLHVRPFTFPED